MTNDKNRKIILRIKIDGKNWNDLINLPCVKEVTKGDERLVKDKRIPHVRLYDEYLPIGLRTPIWDIDIMKRRMVARNGWIGDELVEYNDGTWRFIARKEAGDV